MNNSFFSSVDSERTPRIRKASPVSHRTAITAGLNDWEEDKSDSCPPTLKTGEVPSSSR